jgi:hypothetical protein
MTSNTNWHPLPLLALALILMICVDGTAQQSQPRPSSQNRMIPSADSSSLQDEGPPLNTLEEEMRAKRAIRLAEKEHKDNLNRAREISQLAKELEVTAKKTPVVVDREAVKKIDRLEKLTKKIRGEAGGGDSEITIPDKPKDLSGTMTKITQVADSLSKNVQNTPRQVVSASVIDTANVLLELIKLFRTFAP